MKKKIRNKIKLIKFSQRSFFQEERYFSPLEYVRKIYEITFQQSIIGKIIKEIHIHVSQCIRNMCSNFTLATIGRNLKNSRALNENNACMITKDSWKLVLNFFDFLKQNGINSEENVIQLVIVHAGG